MNIYGPYLDRVRFWNNLLSLECLKTIRFDIGEKDPNVSLEHQTGALRAVAAHSRFSP